MGIFGPDYCCAPPEQVCAAVHTAFGHSRLGNVSLGVRYLARYGTYHRYY